MSTEPGRVVEICLSDLRWLLAGWRGWLLIVVSPMAVVFLAGQVRSVPAPAPMLVAGIDGEPVAGKVVNLLEESSLVDVRVQGDSVAEPYREIVAGDLELLLNFGDAESPGWSLYTASTDPRRMILLEHLASGLHRVVGELRDEDQREQRRDEALAQEASLATTDVLAVLEAGDVSEEQIEAAAERLTAMNERVLAIDVPRPDWWSEFETAEGLRKFGALPVSPLYKYFPAAADRKLRLLPDVMVFMLCLLPFALAVSLTFRPATAGPMVLAVSRVAGPVVLTLLAFFTMLVVAESVYAMHIKTGLLGMSCVVLLAAIASSGLGLALGRVATDHGHLITGLFALASWLLGGMAVTAGEAMSLVGWLAQVLPIHHLRPAVVAWCFGAPPSPSGLWPVLWPLAFLALLYGAGSWIAIRHTAAQAAAAETEV